MKQILAALTATLLASFYSANASAFYEFVASADSKWVNNKIIRYSTSLESPCFVIEILDPFSSFKPVMQEMICSADNRDLHTELSYARFSDFKITEKSIQANLTVVPIRGGLVDKLKCNIGFTEATFEKMVCEKIPGPPTFDLN